MNAAIPSHFARTMQEVYGEAGVEWLKRLPTIIAGCERRWSLAVLPPFPRLSYNYVAPAVLADGRDAVLKVGYPGPELMCEMEALRLYNGHGIVQLLHADREQGAMLLERLKPGTPLASIEDDEEATSIAASVMRQLWRPVPSEHQFPTIARWASGLERLRKHFSGTTGPLPKSLVEEAETLFTEFIASMGEVVLLHGDLHHENIIAAKRQPWLALDPKGLVGEPAYEVGALLRNQLPQPLTQPEASRILARRVDQLAEELGLDRERLISWGLAQAVLSAWWSIEDHGYGWEPAIAVAEALAGIRKGTRHAI
ncbi:MAG TPA: aminoglycoside phosphotransferase family protein [Chloroflexia bacterium]|nr:aminoglycoside phosphotransferase family protein [Chloroflexia bacterium]